METSPRSAQLDSVAPEDLKAADVMTPFPRTCSPYSTVIEAVLIFKDEDLAMVPVVDAGKPLGIVTERDVALAVASQPMLAQQPVSSIMNQDVLTAIADTSLDQISRMMAEASAPMLFVVDADGLLLGVISWTDLVARLPTRTMTAISEPQEFPR